VHAAMPSRREALDQPKGVINMGTSTMPLVKTDTAAGYIRRTARSPLTREHAADVQRAIAACRAAGDAEGTDAAIGGLLQTVAQCAGRTWLRANRDDPDVARFTVLAEGVSRTGRAITMPEASELDDLLAAVLWAAHGPRPAATSPAVAPARATSSNSHVARARLAAG
jgi:hypothetical protein